MRLLFFLSLIWLFTSARAQQPITNENIWTLPQVDAPMLSPDGQGLLYTVTETTLEQNNRTNRLIYLDLDSKRKTELISNIEDPQWSPDGKYITYLSEYGGSYGLYKAEIKIKGKNAKLEPAQRLAEIEQSNHFLGHPTRKNYAWSPDGRHIAFVAADPASCQGREDPNAPLVIERTLYKARTALSDNCLTRIYVMKSSGADKKVLTPGLYDSHSLSWAPDGSHLTYLSNPSDDPDQNYNNELWKVDIVSGESTRLTNTAGTEHDPQWSPGGDWIAYPATVRSVNTKDSPPENTFLYALSTDGERRLNLTLTIDRRATDPQWHPDGEWLYFSIRDEGKFCLYRVQLGGRPEAVLCEEAAVGHFDVGADKIAFTYQSPGQPTEIYTAHLDGSIKQRITFETKDWTADKQFAKVDDFWFASYDGTRIQGFVAYPEGVEEDSKLPVIHRIHGGPHGMYGFTFSDLNELLVGQGYAVVYINPRGSTGYGQRFADGTYQAWGGGDYKDLMHGIDAALEQFDFLDGERMGVMGGSYGGFMTNWVITQTNRYQAAVTIASVSNLISFYGTSLYQLLIETEFGGMPWDVYPLLWHFSPLAHIEEVKTPTLLLHGEDDMDVPITQAEEFYIALKKLRVPARFVRYPNEGHGIRQPQHRRHYYKEILSWFEKYIPVKP